jgi:hypothetical protein
MKSELRMQRYVEKKLQGHFYNFWICLVLYLELFSKNRGSSWNFMDRGLISQKGRGANYKMVGFFLVWIYFSMEIEMDSVHHLWTTETTVHSGLAMAGLRGLTRARLRGRSEAL